MGLPKDSTLLHLAARQSRQNVCTMGICGGKYIKKRLLAALHIVPAAFRFSVLSSYWSVSQLQKFWHLFYPTRLFFVRKGGLLEGSVAELCRDQRLVSAKNASGQSALVVAFC